MRLDLAASYGEERLPRYTSYPTAPHFSPTIGADTYAGWLAELPAVTSASLYLHVPFCREMCWYCGCHTQIVRRDELVSAYQATLRREIEKGFRSNRYEKIVDRTQAIDRAVALARPRDIVLIAGKGHETYQEFGDYTIPFDDIQVARRAIEDHPVEFSS